MTNWLADLRSDLLFRIQVERSQRQTLGYGSNSFPAIKAHCQIFFEKLPHRRYEIRASVRNTLSYIFPFRHWFSRASRLRTPIASSSSLIQSRIPFALPDSKSKCPAPKEKRPPPCRLSARVPRAAVPGTLAAVAPAGRPWRVALPAGG